MLTITKEIKKNIQKCDSIEERLSILKDKYVGETAYVTACGPSINQLDNEFIESKLKNKLVMSIKQSFDIIGSDVCDFHIMNTYNLKPTQYDYGDVNNTIIAWGLAKSYANEQIKKIVRQNRPFDLYIPVINPPFINDNQTINGSLNFDDMKLLGERCEVTWGKGLFYELVIPLLYHMGVKDIITFGFDVHIGQYEHFYGENPSSDCFPQTGEMEQIINASPHFYDWCVENDITIKIFSHLNGFDKRFERINSLEEL